MWKGKYGRFTKGILASRVWNGPAHYLDGLHAASTAALLSAPSPHHLEDGVDQFLPKCPPNRVRARSGASTDPTTRGRKRNSARRQQGNSPDRRPQRRARRPSPRPRPWRSAVAVCRREGRVALRGRSSVRAKKAGSAGPVGPVDHFFRSGLWPLGWVY
jgi:hypothetical protein